MKLFNLLFLALFATSCASIFSKSTYPLTIQSTPSKAKVVIKNSSGLEIYSGQTPTTVPLKASNKFFKGESYIVEISLNGYDTKTIPVGTSIDGWYFGNILIGGILGMLIVDPATGAMYQLDLDFVNISLDQSVGSINDKDLKIYDLSQIPQEWHEHLIEVKP